MTDDEFWERVERNEAEQRAREQMDRLLANRREDGATLSLFVLLACAAVFAAIIAEWCAIAL